MAKEKVNYQEVYDLYQLCSETKDLREFCADYGVNYDKFMNWQRHQLWSEKLSKTVQVEQPKVAKVRITGKPCNSPTVKLEVKQPEGESPIKWVKLQLTSGATLLHIPADTRSAFPVISVQSPVSIQYRWQS